VDDNNVELIDFDYLKELSDNDEEFIKELLSSFVDDISNQIGELESAISQQDSQKRKERAHSIRGAARNVGAKTLFEDTDALENDPKCEGNMDQCMHHINSLREEFGRVQTHIQTYLAK
jgi:DNA phosphorothioation-dependent restriction protein DptG